MNIDKTLETFDEEFKPMWLLWNNVMQINSGNKDNIDYSPELAIKNFLIKAIITEYKSLRDELEKDRVRYNDEMAKTMLGKEITDIIEARDAGILVGHHKNIADQIDNIDKKIINLESKL